MTLTPDRFRELLDAGTADAPPAPPTPLADGRARLRRRRVATAVASTLAAVVVAGGVGLALGGGEERAVEPADPAYETFLDTCRAGLTTSFFDGAPPVLKAAAHTEVASVATFDVADGQLWATCNVDPTSGGAPFLGVHVPATGGLSGFSVASGSAGDGGWWLTLEDRVDPAVAEVRLDLDDGGTLTVTTVDGFYAVAAAGQAPDPPELARVTYLGADGTVLAAEVADGTGSGPLGNEVDGLPLISLAYPSLKGGQPRGS